MFRISQRTVSVAMAYILVFGPLVPLRQATADPPPDSPASHLTDYENSDHAAVIDTLWGVTQPAVLELGDDGGVDVWTDWADPAEPDAQGAYQSAASVLLDGRATPFVVEPEPGTVYFGYVYEEAHLVAGALTSPAGSVSFLGVLSITTVEYGNHEIDPVTVRAINILAQTASVAEASAQLGEISERPPADPGEEAEEADPLLQCRSMDWHGNDGFDCCQLYDDYGISRSICKRTVKACLIGCSVVAVVTVIKCAYGALQEYYNCLDRALLDYRQRLYDHGCDPAPEGYDS